MKKSTVKKLRTVNASLERDIHAAVEEFSSALTSTPRHTTDRDSEHRDPPRHELPPANAQRGKRRLLWFLVILLSLIVIGMWGLNIATVIFDLKQKPSQESTLVQDAKKNISDAFSTFSTPDKAVTSTPTTTHTTTSSTIIDTIADTLKTLLTSTSTATSTRLSPTL